MRFNPFQISGFLLLSSVVGVELFAKVLDSIDDCKGNFILLIHEIENNTGASHGISNWASVAYSMSCESVEFG